MAVSLINIKNTVRLKLPRNSVFRQIIESEPDFLPKEVYHAKADTWWKLLDLEG